MSPIAPRLWLHGLLQLLYPGRCAHCDVFHETSGPLCEVCCSLLTSLRSRPACVRCAAPIVSAGAPCPFCRGKGLAPLAETHAVGLYMDPLKQMVHAMKYDRRWALGETLADAALEIEGVRAMLTQATRIVGVPLHWRRQLQRGYNQADVLARRLSRRAGVPFCRPAVRLRDTETQTRLAYDKRIANMRGAFAVTKPSAITGQHVVVVDDVMTSGATIRSLARELKRAKPLSISALVIAVADPHHRSFESV